MTKRREPNRVAILAMLIVAYTFSFLDRQILGILAGPIKTELALSDTQLGLLGGFAFAIFYTTLGLPFASLADRWSKSGVMTIALGVWSGFTALCGLATGFWTLFLFRIGVGVGEAGGVAPAYAMVSDYFPGKERARALAAYQFGPPVGAAIGVLFGGLLASAIDWRVSFIVVGLAGVALVPFFRMVVRDKVALRATDREAPAPVPGVLQVLRLLATKSTFWLISLGAGFCTMCTYGIGFWLPSYFERSLGVGLADRSIIIGSITLIGGCAGVWFGGWLSDRAGGASRKMLVTIPVIAFLLSGAVFVIGLSVGSLPVAIFFLLLWHAFNMMFAAPSLTALQRTAPANVRSMVGATHLMIVNIIGLGVGTVVIGAVSDTLGPRYGADALKYSLYAVPLFYSLAIAMYLLARRTVERDWIDD